MGQIYYIQSPSGKGYVGQAVSFYSNGKPNSGETRFQYHLKYDKCKAVHAAFVKYGEENMKLKILKECIDEDLTYWEDFYMKELNTIAPHGYNLREAGPRGSMSLEAREKLSVSLRNSEALKKINGDPEKKQREIDSRPELQKRKYEYGILPKHVHYKKQEARGKKKEMEGYAIE